MLRLVRALRPLRAIRKFPELRRTVEAFLRAVPALSTVAALTVFFFLVFGVVGVEMFEGEFHHRCAAEASPIELDASVPDSAVLPGAGDPGQLRSLLSPPPSLSMQLMANAPPNTTMAAAATAAAGAASSARHLRGGGGGGSGGGDLDDLGLCGSGSQAACNAGFECLNFRANPPASSTSGNFDTIGGAGVLILQVR